MEKPREAVLECIVSLHAWLAAEEANLSPKAVAFCREPSTFARYAMARSGNFGKALDLLKGTLAWRDVHVVGPFSCPACAVCVKSHCFMPLGTDATGRLIVYASMARASTNETAVTVRHMVHTLEHAWAALLPASAKQAEGQEPDFVPPSSRWLWLIDFKSFGFSHAMQARTSIETVTTFSNHMPERMGTVLLLSPPTLLDMLVAVLKPFLDARTLSKVHTIAVAGKRRAELDAAFGAHGITAPAQLEWLHGVIGMGPAVPGLLPSAAPLADEAFHLWLPTGRPAGGVPAGASP
jgi:hypothetical protein